MAFSNAMAAILVTIVVTCLVKASIAGDSCVWCDPVTSHKFLTCTRNRILDSATFTLVSPSALDDMRNSMMAAALTMKTTNDTKMRMMNGAFAGELAELVMLCSNSGVQVPASISKELIGIVGGCYVEASGKPHSDFTLDIESIVNSMLSTRSSPKDSASQSGFSYKSPPPSSDQLNRFVPNYAAGPPPVPWYQRNQPPVGYLPSAYPAAPPASRPSPNFASQPVSPQTNSGSNSFAFGPQNSQPVYKPPLSGSSSVSNVGPLPYRPQNAYPYPASYATSNAAANDFAPPNAGLNYYPNRMNPAPVNRPQPMPSRNTDRYPVPGSTYPKSDSVSSAFSRHYQKNFQPHDANIPNSHQPDGVVLGSTGKYASNNAPVQGVSPPVDTDSKLKPVANNQQFAGYYPTSPNATSGGSSVPPATPNTTATATDQYPSKLSQNGTNPSDNTKYLSIVIPSTKPNVSNPSLPNGNDDTTSRAMKFSESFFVTLLQSDDFTQLFKIMMSGDMISNTFDAIVGALDACGYKEYADEIANACIVMLQTLPDNSPVDKYSEEVVKWLMKQFQQRRLFDDNPDKQGRALAEAFISQLLIILSPASPQTENDFNEPDSTPGNVRSTKSAARPENRNTFPQGRDVKVTSSADAKSSSSNKDGSSSKGPRSRDVIFYKTLLRRLQLSSNFRLIFNSQLSASAANVLIRKMLAAALSARYGNSLARDAAEECSRRLSSLPPGSKTPVYIRLISVSLTDAILYCDVMSVTPARQATYIAQRIDRWCRRVISSEDVSAGQFLGSMDVAPAGGQDGLQSDEISPEDATMDQFNPEPTDNKPQNRANAGGTRDRAAKNQQPPNVDNSDYSDDGNPQTSNFRINNNYYQPSPQDDRSQYSDRSAQSSDCDNCQDYDRFSDGEVENGRYSGRDVDGFGGSEDSPQRQNVRQRIQPNNPPGDMRKDNLTDDSYSFSNSNRAGSDNYTSQQDASTRFRENNGSSDSGVGNRQQLNQNFTQPQVSKLKSQDSKERVKILMKWAQASISDGSFDYKLFSRVISGLVKYVQQNNLDLNPNKIVLRLLIESLIACTQLLLNVPQQYLNKSYNLDNADMSSIRYISSVASSSSEQTTLDSPDDRNSTSVPSAEQKQSQANAQAISSFQHNRLVTPIAARQNNGQAFLPESGRTYENKDLDSINQKQMSSSIASNNNRTQTGALNWNPFAPNTMPNTFSYPGNRDSSTVVSGNDQPYQNRRVEQNWNTGAESRRGNQNFDQITAGNHQPNQISPLDRQWDTGAPKLDSVRGSGINFPGNQNIGPTLPQTGPTYQDMNIRGNQGNQDIGPTLPQTGPTYQDMNIRGNQGNQDIGPTLPQTGPTYQDMNIRGNQRNQDIGPILQQTGPTYQEMNIRGNQGNQNIGPTLPQTGPTYQDMNIRGNQGNQDIGPTLPQTGPTYQDMNIRGNQGNQDIGPILPQTGPTYQDMNVGNSQENQDATQFKNYNLWRTNQGFTRFSNEGTGQSNVPPNAPGYQDSWQANPGLVGMNNKGIMQGYQTSNGNGEGTWQGNHGSTGINKQGIWQKKEYPVPSGLTNQNIQGNPFSTGMNNQGTGFDYQTPTGSQGNWEGNREPSGFNQGTGQEYQAPSGLGNQNMQGNQFATGKNNQGIAQGYQAPSGLSNNQKNVQGDQDFLGFNQGTA